MMLKRLIFLYALVSCFSMPAMATTAAAQYMTPNSYDNLYPYMNNTMRTGLNPGTNPTQNNAQINTLTKTTGATDSRRVISRTPNTARSATGTQNYYAPSGVSAASNTTNYTTQTTARSAAAPTTVQTNSARRVVARSATGGATKMATRSSRGDNSYISNTAANAAGTTSTTTSLSATRCLTDYTDCMNMYCEREDTAYNRCYCSSQLSQIDATYQPAIDALIKEILVAKNTSYWTDEEMDEYWMGIFGDYTTDNSWTNLENALDIDWSDTQSRVNGQNAFNTGHDYCVQHLGGCYYMASNLRDVYRSEIARDCSTYEQSLGRLKGAAESILETLK